MVSFTTANVLILSSMTINSLKPAKHSSAVNISLLCSL